MRSAECSESKLEKLSRIQLPNYFKKVGLIFVIAGFVMLIVNKALIDSELFRTILKHGILVGLLLISFSKEKIEDERIANLRMKSFMVAFLIGVAMALLLPIIDYLVHIVMNRQTEVGPVGDFVILWQLLTMQIFSFIILKRVSA
ncbi:MAG: hypothetical protein AB8B74_00770 [Crocinitomicaceae bacterium]